MGRKRQRKDRLPGGRDGWSHYGEDRLRRFAISWLRHGDLATAYFESASCGGSNAKVGSARVEGCRMLRDPRTQAELTKVRMRAAKHAETTLGEWLGTELKITRFDPAWLFDENGNVLALQDMDPNARAAIKSIEVEEERIEKLSVGGEPIVRRTRIKKIKLHAKDGAQARLARYLGAYNRDNEQQSSIERLIAMIPTDLHA